MKKNKIKTLDFKTTSIVELNPYLMREINGGTNYNTGNGPIIYSGPNCTTYNTSKTTVATL